MPQKKHTHEFQPIRKPFVSSVEKTVFISVLCACGMEAVEMYRFSILTDKAGNSLEKPERKNQLEDLERLLLVAQNTVTCDYKKQGLEYIGYALKQVIAMQSEEAKSIVQCMECGKKFVGDRTCKDCWRNRMPY